MSVRLSQYTAGRAQLSGVYVPLSLYCPNFRCPSIWKKKMDNFMCLLEFKCTKRLKTHSQAIPDTARWSPLYHIVVQAILHYQPVFNNMRHCLGWQYCLPGNRATILGLSLSNYGQSQNVGQYNIGLLYFWYQSQQLVSPSIWSTVQDIYALKQSPRGSYINATQDLSTWQQWPQAIYQAC